MAHNNLLSGSLFTNQEMIYSKGSLQYQHFRNAITQVWCSQGTFNGVGVVITDQAEILIGEFCEGDLNGWYVFIGEDKYAYGNAVRNKIAGYGVIKTPELTVFGTFRNDLLEGVAVIARHSENKLEIVEYEKGRQAIQIGQNQLAGASLSQTVSKHFGKSLLTPREYLSLQIGNAQKHRFYQKELAPNLRYFGFLENGKNLGIIFNGDFLQSFGEFNQISLNGLGRFCDFNSNVFDGAFEQGDWTEEGVEYKLKGSSVSKEITNFRKQYHLKQMEFNNCHFVLKQFLNLNQIDLKPPQKFSGVEQLLKTRSRRTTSSLREQSPLKQKLRNYQRQANQYINNQQTYVRSYTKTIDMIQRAPSSTPIPPPSPLSVRSFDNISTKKYQQEQSATSQYREQQDIYDFVKKMEMQEQRKRNELDEIVRMRKESIL